jgi:hypothetical protein
MDITEPAARWGKLQRERTLSKSMIPKSEYRFSDKDHAQT